MSKMFDDFFALELTAAKLGFRLVPLREVK